MQRWIAMHASLPWQRPWSRGHVTLEWKELMALMPYLSPAAVRSNFVAGQHSALTYARYRDGPVCGTEGGHHLQGV